MLNSAEHEIFAAHECKNMNKFSFFSGADKLLMLFLLLINVKMPTVDNSAEHEIFAAHKC